MPETQDTETREEKSAAQQAVMQRLDKDHERIATVLGALEAILQIDEDEDIDWSVVADIISYLGEYPDAVHHPLEDRMFDKVLDKGLTPAERELVHFNLAQHEEIIGATKQLADDVNNILSDIVVPVQQVENHLKRYVEIQRLHMRNENHHLFPLAQRLLSESDWQSIKEEVEQNEDPLFDLQVGKFTGLYDFITSR